MISEQVLLQDFQSLSDNLKQEVIHYVQFLKQKQTENIETPKPRKKRKAGSAEGEIFMSDDFDAPLEDFAEYM